MRGDSDGQGRRDGTVGWLGWRPWLARVVLAGLVAGLGADRADAQAEVRNPTQPILVLNTGGHSAPVFSLVFTTDGRQLLSGGLDKVVHVWNLDEEEGPSLARTIRPPIWRGPRGTIYALALFPEPDAPGRFTLAITGFGVQHPPGNIGLYRYPGDDPASTGEVERQLPAGGVTDPEPQGHLDSVRCLAFDPRGQFLASGSFDTTVRLWDYREGRTVAVLRGHTGPVTALAYAPDGSRLVTAGADGLMILWDLDRDRLLNFDRQKRQADDREERQALERAFNQRVLLRRVAPDPQDVNPDDPAGAAINALAVSPDGRWVVIGRETGRLTRHDAATLGGRRLLPTGDRQGAVEALAFSRDGTRLATSIIRQRLGDRSERPQVRCDVEIRRMPDGALQGRPTTVSNLVYACAFSPDDRYLAFAGGDSQGVFLNDLRDNDRPVIRLEGQGRSVWDVGFSRNSQAIGLARERGDGPNLPQRYWGFDLRQRRVTGFDREALSRAITRLEDGSTIRPVTPYRLQVIDGQGRAQPLDLAPPTDGRWWSYSFIPPGPGHDRLAVAVGTDAGVALFSRDPDDGAFRRVRHFAGHSGSVYALAPSPDGKWLATGASDQTVRLWSLDGCDTLAPFGATFRKRNDGSWVTDEVTPRGFAEAMGLQPEDVIQEVFIAGERLEDLDEALETLDAAAPQDRLEFRVRRGDQTIELGTTKRDQPALSLFLGLDQEWVLWMPHGYYDTSILGDRTFLGWHRNGSRDEGRVLDLDASSDYFTIDKYETELRQRGVIDTLLETGELAVALNVLDAPVADPSTLPRDDPPPVVRIVEPARPADRLLVVEAPELPLRAQARTDPRDQDRRLVRSIRFLVNSQVQHEVNPLQPEVDETARLLLTPGRHMINVVATSDRDRERIASFEVEYRLPPAPPPVEEPEPEPEPEPLPPPREPRLVVLAIGVGQFPHNDLIPAIPFAPDDARAVARFLGAPTSHRFDEVDAQVILDDDVTADRVREALATLDSQRRQGVLGPGDTVFVLIESHFLVFDNEGHLLGADVEAGLPPSQTIPADLVADCLGELAQYGCRVLLLLDAVHRHPQTPDGWNSRVEDWARDLYRRHVVVFLASLNGPSQRLTARAHGAFAQAIIDALDIRSQSRLVTPHDRDVTLGDFRDVVEQNVQRLTGRRQFARCYIPATITPRIAIFDPPTPPDLRRLEARLIRD